MATDGEEEEEATEDCDALSACDMDADDDDDEDKYLLIKYWGGGWKILEFNNSDNNNTSRDCCNNDKGKKEDGYGEYTFRDHVETWLRYLHNHVKEFKSRNPVNEELENFHPTKNLIGQFLVYMLIRYAYLDKFLSDIVMEMVSITTSTIVSTFCHTGPIFSLQCDVILLQKRSIGPSQWNDWEDENTFNFTANKGFIIVKLHIVWLTMV